MEFALSTFTGGWIETLLARRLLFYYVERFNINLWRDDMKQGMRTPLAAPALAALLILMSTSAALGAVCEQIPGMSCRLDGVVAEYSRAGQNPQSFASAEWFKSRGISVAPWGRSVALLVGVSEYQNPKFPKLEFVRRNLAELRKFLLLEERFDEVDILQGSDANSQTLDNLMMNVMPAKAKEGSRFLFYFVGHGLDAGAGVGYMIFSQHPDPEKAFDSAQALDVDVTKRWARKLTAKHALFILDGCALGLGLEAQSSNAGTKSDIQKLTDDPSRLVFAATRGAESTYGDQQGFSYFTGELLQALRDPKADPTNDGLISIISVADLMNPRLAKYPLPARATTQWYNKLPMRLVPDSYGLFFFLNTRANFTRSDVVPTPRAPVGQSVDLPDQPQLRQAYGLIEVTVDRGGALYIDGAKIIDLSPYATYRTARIEAGPHKVKVEKTGFVTEDRELMVRPNETAQMSLVLRAVPSSVSSANSVTLAATTSASPVSRRDAVIRMDFVNIEPGEFMMGCSENDSECFPDERPVHRVRITHGFEIGKYEVTQSQWQAVMGNNPSSLEKGDGLPMESVSWEDVQNFLNRLNGQKDGYRYRLPSEAEWEYAARAGTTSRYAGSLLETIGWFDGNSDTHPHPVGQKTPNRWGLYDMLGNVWEWVQDWYGPYRSNLEADPAGPPNGKYHTARGGAWNNKRVDDSVSSRLNFGVFQMPSDYVPRGPNIGFRVVREAESKTLNDSRPQGATVPNQQPSGPSMPEIVTNPQPRFWPNERQFVVRNGSEFVEIPFHVSRDSRVLFAANGRFEIAWGENSFPAQCISTNLCSIGLCPGGLAVSSLPPYWNNNAQHCPQGPSAGQIEPPAPPLKVFSVYSEATPIRVRNTDVDPIRLYVAYYE